MLQLTTHTDEDDQQKMIQVVQAQKSDGRKDIQKYTKVENSSDLYIQEHQEDKLAGPKRYFENPSSPVNQNPRSSKEEPFLEDFTEELQDDSVHLKKYKSSRVAQLKACKGLQNLPSEDSKIQPSPEYHWQNHLDEGVQAKDRKGLKIQIQKYDIPRRCKTSWMVMNGRNTKIYSLSSHSNGTQRRKKTKFAARSRKLRLWENKSQDLKCEKSHKIKKGVRNAPKIQKYRPEHADSI